MPDHLIPDEAADKLLAGDDLPGGTDQAVVAAAAVLRQVSSPATDDELAQADATIARFVEVVRVEAIPPEVPHGVRRLPISAKAAAIVAAATLWSTGVAAAATGNLPAGLQRAVSETADQVGFDLPRPKADDNQDDKDDEDGEDDAGAATTTIAPTTSSASTTGASTTGASTTAAATSVAATPTVAAASGGSTVASRGVGPDVEGPAHDGLCNAYLKSLAKGHPKNPEAPPWRNLLAAAKDAGQSVEEFCNDEAAASTTVASATATTIGATTTTVSAPTTSATTTTTTTTTISAAPAGNGGNGNGNGGNGNSGGGNSGQGNGGGNGNGHA